MKNRDFKNLSIKEIYHVYNRGVNKEKIFLDKQDYIAFLYRLGLGIGIDKDILDKNEETKAPKSRIRIEKVKNSDFKIHSFCLMPNHFHILIEQTSDSPISSFIQKVCTSFSMYRNKKYKRSGHVFQGNFKSVHVDSNEQLMWVSAYIHMNPVKDGIVDKPENYQWSSYNDFAKERNLPIVEKDFLIETFENKDNLIKQTLLFENKFGEFF